MSADWQVESGQRRSVFVSATTADLCECRRRVSEILLRAGVFPVIQDYFGPDDRRIGDLLQDKILAVDAVVCLIGHIYGTTAADETDGRSYTQLERDLAIQYGKPVYLFVASDSFGPTTGGGEPEASRLKQEAYRQAILTGATKYSLFSSIAELEELIWQVVQPIAANARRRAMRYVHVPVAPAHFLGRQEEVAQLTSALRRPTPCVIAVLGMGGQGKTSLVAHALTRQESLPFSAGVWVSAGQGGFTFNEFLDCALSELLGNRFMPADMPNLDHRSRKLLKLLQSAPTVLVIDAVEHWLEGWNQSQSVAGLYDASLRKGACEGLDGFLAQASGVRNGSHIVLTSRALPAALDAVECSVIPVYPGGGRVVSLQGLSESSAVELLSNYGVVATEQRLREIARSLAYHPLALTGFARVAARLGPRWEPLLSGQTPEPGAAFRSLLDEIRSRLPSRELSERILACASVLGECASPELLDTVLKEDMLQRPGPRVDVMAHVLVLDEWNLLTWDPNAGHVRIHGLVAEYFAAMLSGLERAGVLRSAASWHEAQARESTDELFGEHAVQAARHWLRAGLACEAHRLLFARHGAGGTLIDWMVAKGKLCDCLDLLSQLEALVQNEQQIQCILARAHVLNDMELSQMALADVQRATGMLLAQQGVVRQLTLPRLAQCYGLLGVIHTETGRATQGVRFLDRAAVLLEDESTAAHSAPYAMAMTMANRGLAKWLTGDWVAAAGDYKRALAELNSETHGVEDAEDKVILVQDIHARLALLDLDRERVSEAVIALEELAKELRSHPSRAHGRAEKNRMTVFLSLAAAHIAAGEPAEALGELREVAQAAAERIDLGRWDYGVILAQALATRSKALLALGLAQEAEECADRSVQLYEDVLARGAMQFQGQLSNALFRRADARIAVGHTDEGEKDLVRAVDIAQVWIRDWAGECDIRYEFLSNAMQSLRDYGEQRVAARRRLLSSLGTTADGLRQPLGGNSAALRDAALLRRNWDWLASLARQMNIDWSPLPPAENEHHTA